MSRTPTAADWQKLYLRAILESDRTRMPGTVDLAYKVIRRRAFELWYAGEPPTKERHELATALASLDLLKKFSPVQPDDSKTSITGA